MSQLLSEIPSLATLMEISQMSQEDILNKLGLEAKRTPMQTFTPPVSSFGAGLMLGVGLGVLFAPKSGKATRDDLLARARKLSDAISETRDSIMPSRMKKEGEAKANGITDTSDTPIHA